MPAEQLQATDYAELHQQHAYGTGHTVFLYLTYGSYMMWCNELSSMAGL